MNVQVVSLNIVVVECSVESLNVVVWDVALFLFLKERDNGMSVIAREENDTMVEISHVFIIRLLRVELLYLQNGSKI